MSEKIRVLLSEAEVDAPYPGSCRCDQQGL